jgi:hypothetical protein
MLRPERWQMSMASVLILVLIAGAYWLRPEYIRRETARESLRQQWAEHQALWQRVVAQQQVIATAQPNAPGAVVPFSPVDFQRNDAQLVNWIPTGEGGEMVLEIGWEQIPNTFSLLAERGVQVMAFSIKPGAERLLLTLQLEGRHDH